MCYAYSRRRLLRNLARRPELQSNKSTLNSLKPEKESQEADRHEKVVVLCRVRRFVLRKCVGAEEGRSRSKLRKQCNSRYGRYLLNDSAACDLTGYRRSGKFSMLNNRNWRLTYRNWKTFRQPVGFGLIETLANLKLPAAFDLFGRVSQ